MKPSFRNISLKLLSVSLLFLFVGCEKFKLLKDENMDLVSAGENTKNITFAAFIKSNNYQEADRYSMLKLYAQAVKKAGLETLLDNVDKKFTIVMFTDDAMNQFLSGNGYSTINDVPAEVLKHLILNNIIEGEKYQVIDFTINEEKGFKSLTGDSIFFKRESATTNPYVLKINTVSRYASATATVRSRDLPYKNAVAHVVPTITFTEIAKVAEDEKPTDLPTLKDTLYVTKDVLLTFASSVSGYTVSNPTGDNFQTKMATTVNNSGTRRLYLQFPIRQPKFTGRVGNATLRLFHTRTANATGVTQSQINVYADAKTNWQENTTSYADLPVMGELVSSFEVPTTGAGNTWFSASVSGPVKAAIDNADTFVNIGIWCQSSPNVYFGHKDFAVNTDKLSFVVLESPPIPVVDNVTVNTISLSSQEFYKVITKQNLTATGADDKNIKYIITQAPQKGTIICNGRPLKKGGTFTQHQLTQGVVKYVCGIQTQNTTDEVKLEIQDYRGGYYPDVVTLPIQIN